VLSGFASVFVEFDVFAVFVCLAFRVANANACLDLSLVELVVTAPSFIALKYVAFVDDRCNSRAMTDSSYVSLELLIDEGTLTALEIQTSLASLLLGWYIPRLTDCWSCLVPIHDSIMHSYVCMYDCHQLSRSLYCMSAAETATTDSYCVCVESRQWIQRRLLCICHRQGMCRDSKVRVRTVPYYRLSESDLTLAAVCGRTLFKCYPPIRFTINFWSGARETFLRAILRRIILIACLRTRGSVNTV
jgi:hypothetical protein